MSVLDCLCSVDIIAGLYNVSDRDSNIAVIFVKVSEMRLNARVGLPDFFAAAVQVDT